MITEQKRAADAAAAAAATAAQENVVRSFVRPPATPSSATHFSSFLVTTPAHELRVSEELGLEDVPSVERQPEGAQCDAPASQFTVCDVTKN